MAGGQAVVNALGGGWTRCQTRAPDVDAERFLQGVEWLAGFVRTSTPKRGAVFNQRPELSVTFLECRIMGFGLVFFFHHRG